MKILRKIMISIIFICCIFCFSTNRTYALSEEIRERINFKTVEDDGEPKEEDVDIVVDDGKDLIKSIKLPQITLSFEKVLYGHQDLIDIKFFEDNVENKNELWNTIKGFVNAFYRGALYISFATMLFFLIYMSVLIVKASFKGKDDNIELSVPNSKEKTVVQRLKDKLFIQEWISGIIALGLLTVGINILIYFSEYIMYSSPFGSETEEGIDNQPITVYVKGGEFPVGKISVTGEMTENTDFSSYMFIGDSRVAQMSTAVSSIKGNDIFIAKDGAKHDWLINTALPEADKKVKNGMNVIIWMGTEDWDNGAPYYINAINDKANKWGSAGVTITVGTIGISQYGSTVDNGYQNFNSQLRSNLSSKVRISDLYSYTKILSGNGNIFLDKEQYNDSTYVNIYNFLKSGQVESADENNAINTGKVIRDFYFDTSTEGLMIFLSQYNWDSNASTNIFYIICTLIVSLCKYIILAVFFFRMLILAILMIAAPILVLINIFKRINGTRGFITKWVRLFLYLIFLRPMIYIVYYVLLKAIPGKIADNTLYIIVVCLVLSILCIWSVIKVFKSIFVREKRIKK